MMYIRFQYHCACGATGDLSPGVASPWPCPFCGELLTITAMSVDEPPAGDPGVIPELVFTAQQLTAEWPRGYWRIVGGRMARGEIVVNPRVVGHILEQVAPPEPSPTGCPPGPRAWETVEEFEATLRQVMAWLEKTYHTVPKWRIANAMYRLAQQPRSKREDLDQVLHRRTPDSYSDAARSALRRTAEYFRLDINALIERVWRDLHNG